MAGEVEVDVDGLAEVFFGATRRAVPGCTRRRRNRGWRGGAAACPSDGAALRVSCGPAFGGNYSLIVRCPQCGTDARMGRVDDPLRGSLRALTDAKRKRMVEEAHAAAAVTCPVDGAAIRPQTLAAGGAGAVSLTCLRCSNEHHAG